MGLVARHGWASVTAVSRGWSATAVYRAPGQQLLGLGIDATSRRTDPDQLGHLMSNGRWKGVARYGRFHVACIGVLLGFDRPGLASMPPATAVCGAPGQQRPLEEMGRDTAVCRAMVRHGRLWASWPITVPLSTSPKSGRLLLSFNVMKLRRFTAVYGAPGEQLLGIDAAAPIRTWAPGK